MKRLFNAAILCHANKVLGSFYPEKQQGILQKWYAILHNVGNALTSSVTSLFYVAT